LDAARRAGAVRLTAVIPYLAYARQDRRTSPGEPVSVRVIGDLLRCSGAERVLLVDPHSPDVEAVFGLPTEIVTAVPSLAGRLRDELPPETVVVAPDLGAVDLAEDHARELDRPVAVVRKTRVSGDEVRTSGVVGEVDGMRPLIVDDMIATGGTLVAATEALLDAGALDEVRIAATHGLLVGSATERLGSLPLERLLLTDTVPPPQERPAGTRIASVTEVLAEAVSRMHHERPVAPLEAYR
jgi:ribose-phosphate pyrophosphokinase